MEEEAKARDDAEEEKELDDELEEMEKKFIGKPNAVATKRILAEFKGMKRSKEVSNFKIDFFGNNFSKWQVSIEILKYDLSKDLKADFLQLGSNPKLVFEVTFPENYPFEPPFVRVVSPIFAFRTGHITIGGSICTESITPSGWSSARNVEGVFLEIIANMLDGGARLDLNRKGQSYGFEEAKAAFNRVARDHGWIK